MGSSTYVFPHVPHHGEKEFHAKLRAALADILPPREFEMLHAVMFIFDPHLPSMRRNGKIHDQEFFDLLAGKATKRLGEPHRDSTAESRRAAELETVY